MMSRRIAGALARILAMALAVAPIACGGGEDAGVEVPATVRGDENLVPARLVTVEGCLTASGDRFVLTDLERAVAAPDVSQRDGSAPAAAPEPTTETYRLVGSDARLRDLIGRRVEVSGEAEPEKVVDLRRSSPPMEPRNDGGADVSPDPTVGIVESARIEISDLRVVSVSDAGAPCRTATADSASPR